MPSLRRNIVISALFTLFGGPGLTMVVFPYLITRFRIPPHAPLWHTAVGAILIACGLAPLFESIIRFIVEGRGTLVPTAATQRLVIGGLYRYVRNPMYLGVATAIAGEALLLASRVMFLYLAFVCLAFNLFVRFYEEPRLTRTYPAQYPQYRCHVRRWLPRFTPWTGDQAN